MATDGEGTLYIPAADYYQWLHDNFPVKDAEVSFGPPRVEAGDFTVDFAWSTTDNPPDSWAQKPKALRQWDDAKNVDNWEKADKTLRELKAMLTESLEGAGAEEVLKEIKRKLGAK